jgi:hypothetical protein
MEKNEVFLLINVSLFRTITSPEAGVFFCNDAYFNFSSFEVHRQNGGEARDGQLKE